MSDTATTLHYLYEGFDPHETGEDHSLSGLTDSDRELVESIGAYWREHNAALAASDEVPTEWDGILMEAFCDARAERDPNLQTDAMLRLAATAITYAESIQRQTAAFNAEPKAKK